MGQKKNAYMRLVRKPEGKRTLGIPKGRWVDNIKVNLRKIRELYQQLIGKFASYRISYITLRDRWCHIIVLNVHAPTEDKIYDVKDGFYEELERVFDKFSKYLMTIVSGDFNAEVVREDVFKPTVGNESLHEISNDNGVKVVNFATSKNMTVRSTMFPHCNNHKFTELLLLIIYRVRDVRQTEIHTAEPLVPDPSPFEIESAIAKVKRYKSPGSDQIPAELIQAGGEILRSKIHNLITPIWHKEKLPDQWKESIIVPVHMKGDKTDCSNYRGI
ncbi:hypothetical protein B7P43_G13761 [Cryptotermes secundus]|uniref:Endonuclease/exonuclease/phosphatase domain-containing protein n=1 Tax=Cryptotermes secundus TaxID=105785 RepID=A0A2J7QGL1_9NEOP|nr:hypothetical protein B7P43_G13761 [Cryptotermes secundus]